MHSGKFGAIAGNGTCLTGVLVGSSLAVLIVLIGDGLGGCIREADRFFLLRNVPNI